MPYWFGAKLIYYVARFSLVKKLAGTSKLLTNYANYLKILSEIFKLIRLTRQCRQRSQVSGSGTDDLVSTYGKDQGISALPSRLE